MAPARDVLIAARFLQGVGAALQASVILAIIVTEFPQPAERAKAMSAYVFTAVAGGSLGLLLGGILTQALDWHWIFFVNIPIGLATLAAGHALVPADSGLGLEHGIDWLGSVLITVALMAGVYAIVGATGHGWGSHQVLVPGAIAIALLGAFLALESRIENPIMPLRILRLRGLVASSVVRGFLVTGDVLDVLPRHAVPGARTPLQRDPDRAGLLALDTHRRRAVARHHGATGQPLRPDARADRRHGDALIAGLGCSSTAPDRTPRSSRRCSSPSSRSGSASGCAFMPLLQIAMADVPPADAGLGSGIINVSQQISGALGLAVLDTIATNHSKALVASGNSAVSSAIGGYHLAFVFGGASVAIGLVLGLVLLRQNRSERDPEVTVRDERLTDRQRDLEEAYESGVEDLVEVV